MYKKTKTKKSISNQTREVEDFHQLYLVQRNVTICEHCCSVVAFQRDHSQIVFQNILGIQTFYHCLTLILTV